MKGAYQEAEVWAESVLKDLGMSTTLPVDPFAIAKRKDIDVHVKTPTEDPGVSGVLMRVGDSFAIVCFDRFRNEGFLRFTAAHELGHYFLPGHPERIFRDGATKHMSRAGFTNGEPHEREADQFAAALLMPKGLVRRALNRVEPGLAAVRALSDQFGTSLTAAAIRFAKLSDDPVAVVVSCDGKIEYCFCSESLDESGGDTWIRKGELVPPGSMTSQASARKKEQLDGDVELGVWFDDAPDKSVYEEVLYMPSYGRTLTVLSSTECFNSENDDDDDDDRDD